MEMLTAFGLFCTTDIIGFLMQSVWMMPINCCTGGRDVRWIEMAQDRLQGRSFI